jgi:hypothetical protein
MKEWLRYFQENREHRLEIPPGQTFYPEPLLRAPLIRSLRRFQLGESGEGRHWRGHAALTRDLEYQQCVDLFIKEEQHHARMMARILRELQTPLLQRHWSNDCFVHLRRMFGLEEELLTLLVPEMIAQRFFRALRDGTRDEAFAPSSRKSSTTKTAMWLFTRTFYGRGCPDFPWRDAFCCGRAGEWFSAPPVWRSFWIIGRFCERSEFPRRRSSGNAD